jgi:hypothetical protein
MVGILSILFVALLVTAAVLLGEKKPMTRPTLWKVFDCVDHVDVQHPRESG